MPTTRASRSRPSACRSRTPTRGSREGRCRTCRTERRSTRAASCSVSFPAPNRATASHRFHCHSAISSIPLHGREGGQNRWPLEGGQNRCPSTQHRAAVDGGARRPLRDGPVAKRPTKHGNFLEEFRPGQVFRHKRGKTITEGLFAVFTDFCFTTNALAKNRRYAEAYGFRGLLAPPGLVMNVVFSQSVEDVSENGRANLEYIDMRFGAPVCVGDTIEAESTVLGV